MMRRFLIAVLLALAPATAGARYYDPGTGRFLTEDPQPGDTSNPITLNEFIYANASPAVYVDPTGRSGSRGADEGVDYTYHDAVHAFVTMDSELRKDCQDGAQNDCDFLEFRNHVAITGATLVVGAGLPAATAKAGTALWAVASLLSMQHDAAGGTGVLDPGSAVLAQTAQAARACANGSGIGCFDTFVAGAAALTVVDELVARPANFVELEPALTPETAIAISPPNSDGAAGADTNRVWRLNPFKRGQQIEQEIGHNLPSNFPVIDRFENGVATSIKSLDLDAKTYQNTSALDRALTGYVDKVAGFQGRRWAGIEIYAHDVKARALELVLPHAGSESQKIVINNAIQYGATRGVDVKVIVKP